MHKVKYLIFFSYLFSYLLLDWSYVEVVSKYYRYLGFELNYLSYFTSILFLLVSVVMGFVLVNLKSSQFVTLVASVFYQFLLLPNLILTKYGVLPNGVIVTSIIFISILLFIGRYSFNFKSSVITPKLGLSILFLFSLIMLVPVMMNYGFNLNINNLFLKDIYETRSNSKLNSIPFIGYIDPWLTKVILPILLVFSFSKKLWSVFLITACAILYMFLTAGHKTVLFSIFLVVLFSLSKSYKQTYLFFNLAVVFIILIARIVYIYSGNFFLDTLLIRRLFFVPSLLNKFYFQEFENNPIYLSHSIFKNFLNYTYEYLPANHIGNLYYGSPLTSANNGIISDSYMNFGYMGVLIFGSIAGIYFMLISSFNLSHRYFGVILILIFSLISGPFLTAMLTKGGIILIVISFILLKNSKYKKYS